MRKPLSTYPTFLVSLVPARRLRVRHLDNRGTNRRATPDSLDRLQESLRPLCLVVCLRQTPSVLPQTQVKGVATEMNDLGVD
jgi:hypothetical protein